MPGGYGGSAGGGGGGGDGGGDGGGGGDGEGSAHSSEAHTYSRSNPQPVPPHLASCSASVHSRIESASHLALAAACDTAASEQSGLLHDAPFSAQHRTAPVAPPGSAHAVSPGMSLYSLAPIELNGSGGDGGGDGGDGGDGGGLGDRGGAGGEHPSKVQSNKLSMPQPVPMQTPASSARVHSRQPCAAHSAIASAWLAASPSMPVSGVR